jgi:transcriptional regulator with XRE-family HTH domain
MAYVKRIHPADIEAGRRVRSRRKELGMTQDALAQALGISFQQLQKYETGASRISASRILGLAGALNVNPNYFFSDNNSKVRAPPDIAIELFANADGRRLAEAFQRIPKVSVRRQVVALVQTIADRDDKPARPHRQKGYS